MLTDSLSQIAKYTIEKIDKIPQDAITKLLETLIQERELLLDFLGIMNRAIIIKGPNSKVIFHNPCAIKWGIIDKTSLNISEDFKDVFNEIEKKFSDKVLIFESQRALKVRDSVVSSIKSERVFDILCVANFTESRYMYILNDITEKTKETLDESQKKAMSLIDTLLAGIAHELKNPISSIYFHSQVIKRSLPNLEGNKDKIGKSIDVIISEVGRLNKLVNDFIQSLRPFKFVEKYEDINKIIKEVAEMLLEETNSRGIFLELILDDSVPEFICDRDVIKTLILNLLRNSIDAIEKEEGKIIVRTFIASKDSEDYIVISIKDNGKGIPEEIKHRIFEPYFTTKRYGSGLGLSIVYKIVKDYNGFIEFDSKEGEGTEFRIFLPVGDKLKKLTI